MVCGFIQVLSEDNAEIVRRLSHYTRGIAVVRYWDNASPRDKVSSGLKRIQPRLLASHTSQPSVSVPMKMRAYPAAMALAEPKDDPTGIWPCQSGLQNSGPVFAPYALTALGVILLCTSTHTGGLSLFPKGRPAAGKVFSPIKSMPT